MLQFIHDHSHGTKVNQLTKMFNERFKLNYSFQQITSLRYRIGCKSGIDCSFKKGERRSPSTEFKKGHLSWNKGTKGLTKANETSFAVGRKPHNMHPVGTIMMRGDGYIWIKLKETIPSRFGWRQLHLHRWEETYGPIPKGHKIIFLDSDRTNCELSNLMMITDGQMATLNKHNLIKKDPELTKTGVIIAELISKTYQVQTSKIRKDVRS